MSIDENLFSTSIKIPTWRCSKPRSSRGRLF